MTISQTLKTYLDHEHIHYDLLPHQEDYCVTEPSPRLPTPAREAAKTLIMRVDERFVMAVLPANWDVDLHHLRDVFLTHHVRLATENEIRDLSSSCALGAMPPFDTLYRLPVYVDQSLTEEEEILFQTGIHSDEIRMRYMDFAALVFPVVVEFYPSPSAVW